ncbi:DUF4157 domain-containing protein [Streptomyces sp. NPDC008001]|uniref:eCIS core domain-containing protein n=1 Tax=Streptomyces sp. NPDC008001 TaxID=3364804 RepID=UPI0036EAA424
MAQAITRAISSPGRPLDPAVGRAMASHHGYDFIRVRVHTRADADASARLLGTAAYAAGRHLVFAAGHYRPDTPHGRLLLAHELAHVVQQAPAPLPGGPVLVQRSGPLGFLEGVKDVFKDVFTRGPAEAASRLFAEGTFQPEEIQRYLEKLRRTGKPEDAYDSDNKARALIAGWAAGDRSIVLDPGLKKLLVRELYLGSVSTGDAQAILTLLERSLKPDIVAVFSADGVTAKQLHDSFGRAERARLVRVLDLQVEGGFAAAMQGRIAPSGGLSAAPNLNDESFRKQWEEAMREGIGLLEKSKSAGGCAFPGPGELRSDTEHFGSSQTGLNQFMGQERFVPKGSSPYRAVELLFQHLDRWTCECLFYTQLAQLYAWRKLLPEPVFNTKFAGFSTGGGRGTPTVGLEAQELKEPDHDALEQAPVGSVVAWFNSSPYARAPFQYEHAIKTFHGTGGGSERYAAHPFGSDLTEEDIKRHLAEASPDFPHHFQLTDGDLTSLATDGVPPAVVQALRSVAGVDRVTWPEYLKLPPLADLVRHRTPEAADHLRKIRMRARKAADPEAAARYVSEKILLHKIEVPR